MRRPCKFRETDIKRVLRAVRAAGIENASLEIEPVMGKILIAIGSGSGADKITDLDRWIADHARQT